jgi:sulfate permease, SulP family
LFFASIGRLGEQLKAELVASHPSVKHVLLDAEAVNRVDTSACDALQTLIRELQRVKSAGCWINGLGRR